MLLSEHIAAARSTLAALEGQAPVLDALHQSVAKALRQGGRVLTCGNGGSAAQAQHLVTELVGRFKSNRRSLPALFLGGDATQLTCISNDFSPDEVFSRPLEGHARPEDVLVAFTTSGNSANVLRVLEAGKRLGITSAAFLGGSGGKARGLANFEVLAPSSETARIQEAHLLAVHWLCDQLEVA